MLSGAAYYRALSRRSFMTYEIAIDGKSYRLDLSQAEGCWSCRVDGREVEVDAVLARPNVLSLRLGNKAYEVKCERVGGEVHIWVGSQRFAAEVRDPRSFRSRSRAVDDHGPKKLTAPMPGKVVRILLSPGAEVEAGGVPGLVPVPGSVADPGTIAVPRVVTVPRPIAETRTVAVPRPVADARTVAVPRPIPNRSRSSRPANSALLVLS